MIRSPERLIVFGRYPEPGQTKTRLVPALGALGAADLSRCLAEHALSEARRWAGAGRGRQVEVRYDGGSERKMRRWLGPGLVYRRQRGSDLGRRMASALQEAYAAGARRTVLIGTDVPAVRATVLGEAFEGLKRNDLVLGPTRDGGYWLIGAKRPPAVFDGVSWGTESVLDKTLGFAASHRLRVVQLEALADVDRPEDLSLARRLFDSRRPVLSVVIPALNEAARIEAAIRSARAPGVEILLVDGGSADETAAIAARLGVRVLTSPPGRARQQNAGAARARADLLLFLHADTILPEGYAPDVFEAMLDRGSVGGAFLWRTDLDTTAMRIARWFVRLRTVYGREPWGDQALFVRRRDFEALGGFPDVPIAEDWSFVRRLRRRGRLAMVEKEVVTSARRWRRIGVARTFLINHVIVLGCRLGVSRHLLARWY